MKGLGRDMARTCLGTAVAILMLAGGAMAMDLVERPMLVLDPGMHVAAIIRLDVDADGTIAVTGSFDGTVRIWNTADGKLQRTIRLPRNPGNVG
jgi:sugar lactone lactonase YvrE